MNAVFSASSERDVLVAGRYTCMWIEQITEPGTFAQYGYKVPMYVLKEH